MIPKDKLNQFLIKQDQELEQFLNIQNHRRMLLTQSLVHEFEQFNMVLRIQFEQFDQFQIKTLEQFQIEQNAQFKQFQMKQDTVFKNFQMDQKKEFEQFRMEQKKHLEQFQMDQPKIHVDCRFGGEMLMDSPRDVPFKIPSNFCIVCTCDYVCKYMSNDAIFAIQSQFEWVHGN